jgi:diadenosine tetraphosphate (Ap4A) HIT family hydrolase
VNAAAARSGCELCEQPGGLLIRQSDEWRCVRVADPAFPAFYRVIWNRHVAEFTDLDPAARQRCMAAVSVVEEALRAALRPTKVNLASLGNVVAHLHWHVIARFDWDSRFPQPVWAPVERVVEPPATERLPLALDALDTRIKQALAGL